MGSEHNLRDFGLRLFFCLSCQIFVVVFVSINIFSHWCSPVNVLMSECLEKCAGKRDRITEDSFIQRRRRRRRRRSAVVFQASNGRYIAHWDIIVTHVITDLCLHSWDVDEVFLLTLKWVRQRCPPPPPPPPLSIWWTQETIEENRAVRSSHISVCSGQQCVFVCKCVTTIPGRVSVCPALGILLQHPK